MIQVAFPGTASMQRLELGSAPESTRLGARLTTAGLGELRRRPLAGGPFLEAIEVRGEVGARLSGTEPSRHSGDLAEDDVGH